MIGWGFLRCSIEEKHLKSALRWRKRESNSIKANTLLHVLSLSTGDLKQYSITCSIKPNLLLEWKENIETVVRLNFTFLKEQKERMCVCVLERETESGFTPRVSIDLGTGEVTLVKNVRALHIWKQLTAYWDTMAWSIDSMRHFMSTPIFTGACVRHLVR